MRWTTLASLIVVVGIAGVAGWVLLPGHAAQVVLYCSVDQDHSRSLVQEFEDETRLAVDFHGDVEANKSIGLATRLSSERGNPQADVFWANEPMHTVWLADAGVLDVLPDDVLALFPEPWRDPQRRWVMLGLRARVLLVNTELVAAADLPTRVTDLVDWKHRDEPRYKHLRTAMAEPTAGTTYTHAVALLSRDEVGTMAFLDRVMAAAGQGRMSIVPGNGPAMRLVQDAKNNVAFCLTDTDDAWFAKSAGAPVAIVYPDQGEGEHGTVVLPNTLALVKGRRHPRDAERLLRWLADPKLEARLAAGPSAQMPVREGVAVPADGHVKRPGTDFRTLAIDWRALGANRDRWLDALLRKFRPGK